MSSPEPTRSRRSLSPATLACALAIALAATASPAEDADHGLHLHPSLSLRGVFDDNVFLEDDRTSDFALWIAPRLQADYANGPLRAGLDAGADLRRYRHETSLNEDFGRVSGFGELDLTRGLTLRLANSYVPYPERLGLPEDDSENLVQTNRAEAELRYRRPFRRESSVQFALEAVHFTTGRFSASVDEDGDGIAETVDDFHGDFLETKFQTEVQRGLGRRALVFARAGMRRRNFDELSNSDFNEYSSLLGLQVRWPARLELDATAGYGYVDFDDLDAKDRFLGTARLKWEGPRGFTWQASAENRFTSDATGQDFTETTARFGIGKQLGKRMHANLEFAWSRFDDDGSDHGSDTFRVVSVRLRRQVTRHLQVALGYRHWHNGGNDSTRDFDQNRAILEFVYAR
ncbi:MAG: outer membrane beta-barrel protein [Deltaproteobacteria bacterium]|nr:MAG: outer membrane beta-barrel protein [Deltaproteobacteria bacterium]